MQVWEEVWLEGTPGTDVKNKLEHTLDDMDSAGEKEKKVKYSVEKERRKLEGNLKMCQGSVSDMEKDKREMEQSGGRTRNHEWKMTLI